MNISCKIKGVPRIKDIYTLVIFKIIGFLLMRQKETISPKGRETISVTAKIIKLVAIPELRSLKIFNNDIETPSHRFV
jgi:hypothetical protein